MMPMREITFMAAFAVLTVVMLVSALSFLPANSIVAEKNSEADLFWSSRRSDTENTGFNQGPAPDTNQTLWTASVGPKSEGGGGGYVPSATVGYGKIFVGSRDGVLHAMDARTGDAIWNQALTIGDLFGPAVAHNRVYVVSDANELFAIDEETGNVIWTKNIPASPSINVADDRLFVAAFNGSFYCVNATSGATLWTRDFVGAGTYIITHPALAYNRVFLGALCLNETDGAILWNMTLSGQQGIGSRNFPAVGDGKVFIGINDTMFCLEAISGSVIWNYTIGGEVFRAPPAIAYGKLFIPSTDGFFYCLDVKNGTVLWKKPDVGGIVRIGFGSTSAGAAVADGKIYLPHPDWAITCLNATNGEFLWRFLTEGPPAPPIVAGGSIFATLVHDPQIYALGKPAVTPSPTVQPTAEPTQTPNPTPENNPADFTAALILGCIVTIVAICALVYYSKRKG